jgi:hypothetical protein
MIRPCYLVLDREYPGSISTRKLVIETAKLNVITAYSPGEAVETLGVFPRVSGVVINGEVAGITCAELVNKLRAVVPGIPMIVTSPNGQHNCGGDVHYVNSLDPKSLLDCLQRLNPSAVKEIVKQDPQIPH